MDAERQALSDSDGKEPQPKQKQKKHFKNKMHLWEFLLELLADNQRRSLIAWTRREKGEFKIIKTEEVAKLWGFENGRQGMTYDKLSRALRQYYTDGIIAKVKGQKTTYKFDKLPYDYYPGVTRSLNSVKERKNSPCAENGMSYRHDPGREILWCSPQGQSSTQNEEIPFGIYLHPANSPEEGRIFCAQTTTSNYNGVTRYDAMERLPVNLPRPSMLPFPISPKTQIWFREVAEKNTRGHHASLSSMQSFPFHASAFATPKSSRSNSPSNTLVENESRNVLPSTTYTVETPESSHFNSPLNIQEKNGSRSVTTSVIYPRYFPTAESHRISSPLTIVEQNTSRNITPNDIYQGPFMTLESSNPSSPLNVMENSVSRNVTSPAAAYPPFPVRLTNNVILPTPVCPWVHTVPYQPLVYSVSVPYDPRPVITSVVGNYLGHPTLKT